MFWKLRSFKLMSLATSSKFQVLSVSGVAGCPILISARPLQSYNSKSFGSFFVAGSDLCLSVAKFQVTRVPEVFWSQIPISACLLQSSQVTRVPEVFWSQIPISACLFQSSQVTRVPEVFWLQIPISACMLQSSQVTRVPEVF